MPTRKTIEPKTCESCFNYIFCPSWGESKCAAKALWLPNGPIIGVDEFGVKRCTKYTERGIGRKPLECHCDACEGFVDTWED